MYYLIQEILFNIQEEMNNVSTHHQPDKELSSLKCTPNIIIDKRNINKEKNIIK